MSTADVLEFVCLASETPAFFLIGRTKLPCISVRHYVSIVWLFFEPIKQREELPCMVSHLGETTSPKRRYVICSKQMFKQDLSNADFEI